MCKRAKELRQELEFALHIVLQDRPNTAVQVSTHYNGSTFVANGFSKVCWPDWWNKQRGIEIAQGKAEANIVRQILHKQRSDNAAAFVQAFADKAREEAVT